MLSNKEIRQLFISDKDWERTSGSWKALLPNRDFNQLKLNDETEEEYRNRLIPRFNIPLAVIKQWLYPLFYDYNSTNNYGWINYDKVIFKKIALSSKVISNIYIVNNYKRQVTEAIQYKSYDDMPCTEDDKNYWKDYYTWRVPPILLNVKSLNSIIIPKYAEIDNQSHYQLIEGHSRFGYLLAAQNLGINNKDRHEFYLMEYKES